LAPVSRESEPAVSGDMWAIVSDGAGVLRDTRVSLPGRAIGEVRVRVLAAGLTSGYDAHDPVGSWPGTVTLSGTVEDADPGHGTLLQRLVAVLPSAACLSRAACQGGEGSLSTPRTLARPEPKVVLSEHLNVAIQNVIPVVPGRPLDEATLLHAAASVLGAVRRAQIQIGDSVAVLGTGIAAVLAAQWVRVAGAYDVYIIERDTRGIALARKLWLGERIEADIHQAGGMLHTLRGGCDVDVAILPTGDPAYVKAALSLVRPGGRVLVLGHYGLIDEQTAALAQAAGVGVICGDDATDEVWREDMEIAARTWGSGRLALRDLIVERVPLRDLAARLNSGALPDQRYLVAMAEERC
jgi:threonine dehydrogenase-like Zn-dependent dehydrogenase